MQRFIELGDSYIKWCYDDDHVLIESLYVSPKKRGEHIGHYLINKLKKLKKPIHLYAVPFESTEEDWLIKYYEKYGFKSSDDDEQYMIYNN